MNIKIFMGSASCFTEREILRSFGEGINVWLQSYYKKNNIESDAVRIGRWKAPSRPLYTMEYDYGETYRDCDIAVMFGSWKPREKGHHAVRNSVVSGARKFIVIETPLINRTTTGEHTEFRVGINGFLNRDAWWVSLSPREAKAKLKTWQIDWPGWKNNPDGHVLLALQLPGDASLRGIDINDWAFTSICQIRKISERPIVIRNHPLCSQRAFSDHAELAKKLLLGGITNLTFSDGAVRSWREDIEGAYCTVTYTSGLAVDSVLSGIPTIACDPGNFTYGISSNFPRDVESLKLVSQEEIGAWLCNLAGCQWSLDEFVSGIAWSYLLPVVTEKLS